MTATEPKFVGMPAALKAFVDSLDVEREFAVWVLEKEEGEFSGAVSARLFLEEFGLPKGEAEGLVWRTTTCDFGVLSVAGGLVVWHPVAPFDGRRAYHLCLYRYV